jgi:energy-coupling factor transport system permease protein
LDRDFSQPRVSALHALHPLTKLVAVLAILLIGFLARWAWVPIALVLFVILPLAAWGKILGVLLRAMVIVTIPFAISVFLVQGLFFPGPSPILYSLGPLGLKEQGLALALATTGRILLLAGAGLLLLFSTYPSDLMLAMEERGAPRALTWMIVAAIQLVPQIQGKAAGILDAQRSRGLETEGPLWTRVRALIPLIVPLIFSELMSVDERALALEVRAFSSTNRKTSFVELSDSRRQAWTRRVLAVAAIVIAAWEIWPV